MPWNELVGSHVDFQWTEEGVIVYLFLPFLAGLGQGDVYASAFHLSQGK